MTRHLHHRDLRGDDPDRDVCDFCLSPDVKWTFPCRDFTTHDGVVIVDPNASSPVSMAHVEYNATGDWAACPACHALIVRGLRDRLAVRSAKGGFKRHPELTHIFSLKRYTAFVRARQDIFWSHRCGKPIPADHPLTKRGEER